MSLIILSQALKVRAAKGVSNSKWNNSGISNRGEVALLTEQQTALCEVSLKILSSFARNFLDKEPLFLFRKHWTCIVEDLTEGDDEPMRLVARVNRKLCLPQVLRVQSGW